MAAQADRINRRNGHRERRWDTRVGTIELDIPKLRKGSYFPDWLLQPRRRSERALVQVVTECQRTRGWANRAVRHLKERALFPGTPDRIRTCDLWRRRPTL